MTAFLAIACVLCVVGAALAAGVWFTGASNGDTTITTGQAITMELKNVVASNNNGLYPGDTAQITLSADNKNFNSILTIKLEDSTSGTDYSAQFTITYSMGETNDAAYGDGITIAANASAQSVTLKIQLNSNADADVIAGKTIKVTIELNKAAA